jgi:hypothetical protein
VLGSAADASFRGLREGLPGPVGVAVRPLVGGSVWSCGDTDPARAWSAIKVPVLVALLRGRGRTGLTATERAWARLAITESDNQAILDLFAALQAENGGLVEASAAVEAVLRVSGDTVTTVATAPPSPGSFTTFGQTLWSVSEAVKFFAALARGDLLPADSTGYILGLMAEVVPEQRWGLGAAGFDGAVALKGGWGPEPDGACLVRQCGVIGTGRCEARSSDDAAGVVAQANGFAVALLARPPAGEASFETGTEMLSGTARWLRDQLSAGCV